MNDDLIRRQAAIDETWKEPSYTDPYNVLTEVRERIQSLPSAQPYTENDYIAEFIKERHPYMLDSFSFSAWKLKRSCDEKGEES